MFDSTAQILDFPSCRPAVVNDPIHRLDDHIRENWDSTIRNPYSEANPDPSLAPLPYPYTVPCASEGFRFFFYWDTYFTNLGLLAHGRLEQVLNNIENMAYLVETRGFMPNHIPEGTTRSQPPLFIPAVRDYYERTGDEALLARMYPAMKKEYDFWMRERLTPCGLNRYFHCADADYLRAFPEIIAGRVSLSWNSDAELLERSAHYLAEAESGWDFNPRFGGRCADFAPVDLNSILYACEGFLAQTATRLNKPEESLEWRQAAAQRQRLMRELLWDDKQGMYFDYDFVNSCWSPIPSAAAFVALWAGVAEPDQALALKKQLPSFMGTYGIAVTPDIKEKILYQWMFPVMWPPIVGFAIHGLMRYGFKRDAGQLATLYLDTVSSSFSRTGQLWEKYDVNRGGPDQREYSSTRMMGWTAGVFAQLANYRSILTWGEYP